MPTKKNVLFLSGIIGGIEISVLVIFLFFGTINFVQNYGDYLDNYYSHFLVFVPVLFFSLITYKLRDEVFDTWVKFAKWWVSGTFIFVLIVPAQDSSLLPITKEIVSFFSTGMFTLVSLIIVIATSVALRGKK